MEEGKEYPNKEILVTLADYCKYIYEKERERTERLEKKVSVFIFAIGGGLLGAILQFPVENVKALFGTNYWLGLVIISLFIIMVLCFLIAIVFTYLSYKVYQFEGLARLEETAQKSSAMQDNSEMLIAMIADYVVASKRNHAINDRKASHLARALLLLVIGLALFTLGISMSYISFWFNGG